MEGAGRGWADTLSLQNLFTCAGNDGAKHELQAGTWPWNTWHGHAGGLHATSSILLCLSATPAEIFL